MHPKYTPKDIARFWSKVQQTTLFDCWNWISAIDRLGYGNFWFQGHSRLSHRIAWELSRGEIPDGMDICHRCDNRACVNPAHLFLGTHTDNMHDMIQKGRMVVLRGERNGRAKLTSDEILYIRTRYATGGITQRELAREMNVSQRLILNIIHNRTWRHL